MNVAEKQSQGNKDPLCKNKEKEREKQTDIHRFKRGCAQHTGVFSFRSLFFFCILFVNPNRDFTYVALLFIYFLVWHFTSVLLFLTALYVSGHMLLFKEVWWKTSVIALRKFSRFKLRKNVGTYLTCPVQCHSQ